MPGLKVKYVNLFCSCQNSEEPHGTCIPSLEMYEYMYFKRQDSLTFMYRTVQCIFEVQCTRLKAEKGYITNAGVPSAPLFVGLL
jgi:hypothetical protein